MQFVAGMDVGDMHLENRPLENLQGVVDRNRGEGIGGGIDDEGVRRGAGRLYQVDQFAFVVRLVKCQLRPVKAANSSQEALMALSVVEP